MSNISLKRLMHDYKNMSAELLADKGIYTKVNDENIYEAYALILGPSDTPYDSGFYFFKFNFCKIIYSNSFIFFFLNLFFLRCFFLF